ncbi:cytochrome P450 [Ampelomyces quisqualis]|uniref:Cytochrome P450 n=1 Tax=Ampelomyces quisqualis TaxID=50730 RepID=A0A6A5R442_AMPQU|nr:cytochrome P450 [Ampelomyces quisqualis]
MLEHLKTHKTLTDWMLAYHTRHQSPIVQIFTNIFGRPWVVISDYREAQDILMRRSKEFDKPDLISDIFYGISPKFHAGQTTDDAWRHQRKLIQDLVTPAFLNEVAAPQLHHNFMDLINMWLEKMRLGKGRPFAVKHDIYETALEAIWAAIFGLDDISTVTRNQIKLLSSQMDFPIPSSLDKEVVFPRATAPPAFRAVLEITDGIEAVIKSPFPRLTGFFQRYTPAGRKNHAEKKSFIAKEIAKAKKRIIESGVKETKVTNAVDHMLRRENAAAERVGRLPDYSSQMLADELFGLLIAGHDTTSTTLLWALKFLAANQSMQIKLRAELRSALFDANSESRIPTAHEIASCQNHYLDACIEEINRVSCTGSVPSRNTITDAVVLGHVIPKGTRVCFLGQGHGILEPAFPVPESLHSERYRQVGDERVGSWDLKDMKKFDPERWLVHDPATTTDVYDSTAGPHIAFGGGLRGCFGKKLAYLELRMAIVLMVWNFVLEEVPEEYGSWEAVDMLTHSPIMCYVKLSKA